MKRGLLILAVAVAVGCSANAPELLSEKDYTGEVEGKQINLYTLHAVDIWRQVSNYGGHVISLYTPDRNGKYNDIVLGRPNLH